MADFNITVDTLPMAASLETVSGHVKNVTGAVVAMQSAVVAAEESASKQICRNVDNGFFILMKSQLSQKIAACSSTMSSHLMLMQKFSLDIQRIQETMKEDYNRICRRYLKQFNALDNALESRIRELDKTAMEMGELQQRLSANNSNSCAAAFLYPEDIELTGQKLITSKVKTKSARAIEAMTNDVLGTKIYTESVNHILNAESVPENTVSYVPVLYAETDSMFDSSSKVENIYAPENRFLSSAKAVTEKLQEEEKNFTWKPMEESELEKVKNSFTALCSSSGLDSRVLGEMMRLFEEGKTLSAAEGGM